MTTWVSRGITAAAMISMFQLAPVNSRYQKAGLFRALMLVCSLIAAFLYVSSILTLAASVFSIIAVYQEYSAHSELIADMDTKLSGKWHSLFNWGIVAAVLVSFGSIIAVLIVTMLQMDAVTITAVIVGVLSVPQLVIDIVYILYLKRMVWQCKASQNFKALLSTTIPDGMYYEVTCNDDKDEIYLDAYKKFENRCIPVE